MIYLSYFILATIVVLLSIKISEYVDLIDRTTNLSGAFIGGILLSAVTSLPELLTTISATVGLDNPSLSVGNILGSNFFNLTVLATIVLLNNKFYKKSKVSKSHFTAAILLCFIYVLLALNLFKILDFNILGLNITSILIFTVYIFALKNMANDDNVVDAKDTEINSNLSTNSLIFKFILCGLLLVVASISITYITDIISVQLNLGAGLAGAIFLGIATSLPEVTACISLVNRKNFNLAIGNILGSNLFNFLVLFICDLVYTKGSVYMFNDPQTINLLLFSSLAMMLMCFVLNQSKKTSYMVSSAGIMLCYLLFLTL